VMRIRHCHENRGTMERTTDNVITIGVFLRIQPNTLTQVCSRSLCWESCEVFPVLDRSAHTKKANNEIHNLYEICIPVHKSCDVCKREYFERTLSISKSRTYSLSAISVFLK